MLEAMLDWYRAGVVAKVAAVSQTVASATPVRSATSIAGLVEHLALVDESWFAVDFAGQSERWANVDWDADADWEFHAAVHEPIEEVVARYQRSCDRSRAAATGRDLDEIGADTERREFTLRFVYLHLIEETARHPGPHRRPARAARRHHRRIAPNGPSAGIDRPEWSKNDPTNVTSTTARYSGRATPKMPDTTAATAKGERQDTSRSGLVMHQPLDARTAQNWVCTFLSGAASQRRAISSFATSAAADNRGFACTILHPRSQHRERRAQHGRTPPRHSPAGRPCRDHLPRRAHPLRERGGRRGGHQPGICPGAEAARPRSHPPSHAMARARSVSPRHTLQASVVAPHPRFRGRRHLGHRRRSSRIPDLLT